MDPDPNSSEPSIPKSRSRLARRLFLAFTAMVGFGGIGLLTFSSTGLYQMDCTMTLLIILPSLALGVVVMLVCGLLLFFGTDSNNSWRFYVAAAVSIFVIPAFFLLVVNPIASKQRVIRHMEEMKEIIPHLNEIVVLVDASKDQLGHIPADEAEFIDIVFSDNQFNDDAFPCCWAISYNMLDSERYVIQYSALDVLYAYDSSTPERGWHPTGSELER